jgi:hypothetical protein
MIKTDFLQLGIILFLVSSCASYDHLPNQEEVKTNGRGSYITVTFLAKTDSISDSADVPVSEVSIIQKVEQFISLDNYIGDDSSFEGELFDYDGELIAIDSNSLYIMLNNDSIKGCVTIDKKLIVSYEIQTAKPNSAVPAMVLLTLGSLSHGTAALFTLPLNVLIMGVTNDAIQDDNRLLDTQVEWKDLYKYTRFPQGFPLGLKLEEIK